MYLLRGDDVMESLLIAEMATMKGGRGRLKKIREKCEREADRLSSMVEMIDDILADGAPEAPEELVDSIGE